MPNTESLLLPDSIGKRVDPTYSKTLQSRLQELLHCQADCFPGSQPVSFESKHLEDIQREDYFVCEKSDGVRYLLFFLHSSKGPASFLYDRNKYWYYVPNLLFPVRGRENEFLKDTLMDGELVLDIDQHKKTWRYLIFDLMVVNGSTIIQRSFSTRLGMLQQDVIQPFNARMRTQTDPSALPPFTIELKKMERSYGLHLVFEQIPKLKHKSDGIIWTPVKYPYTSGSCEKLLKWKPPELYTVDFRIAARWSKEHKPIYSIEVLSNGVTYKFYDHFQPEPALATEWKSQLPDGRIAEFRYDPDCEVTIIEQGYAPTVRKGGWRFVRFRDDKSTANDEMVVKKILHSIQDGVTKEQLLLYMDRVRAAWKAREKGLPMPLLHTPKQNLSLSTQITPTSSALNTPTSANTVSQSPSSSSGIGYFREDQSRSNSISDDSFLTKRKSSASSITTPSKEEVDETDKKRLQPVQEETTTTDTIIATTNTPTTSAEKVPTSIPTAVPTTISAVSPTTINPPTTKTTITTIPVNNNKEDGNSGYHSNVQKESIKVESPPPLPPPPIRRRKISSIDINDVKKYHNDSDPPSSNEKKQRMTQKRTASAPSVILEQKEEKKPIQPLPTSPTPLLPPPPLIDNPNRQNRRSKSIPQLPKDNSPKKLKQSSSSSIHNLLTTSMEPATTRAYNFSTILQKKEIPPQTHRLPQQPQPQQHIYQHHPQQPQLNQQQLNQQQLNQQQLNQQRLNQHQLNQQQQQQQQQHHHHHHQMPHQKQQRPLHQQQVAHQPQLHQQQLHPQQISQHRLQPQQPQSHPQLQHLQPQPPPVQFINYHAEGRQNPTSNSNNNHVMIIRSESLSQPSTQAWKNNHGQQSFPYNNNSSSYHPPYQEYFQPYPQPQHYRRNEQQVAPPPPAPPPPPPSQQQQPQAPQLKRKNSQKAKLDFILN